MTQGPLAGIRVLEFSQIVAVPVGGINLSDLGADVVKVEPPGGEQTRRMGAVVPFESKSYQSLNRGKRSLVVDLQKPEGRALIQRLVPGFDVVTSNYRLGVAERLGIDYESLRKLRNDIIVWQNTGFGDTGPEAARAGSDIVAQAYSGLMATDSKADDDGAPDLISIAIADFASGMVGAMGICAALYHRERTGEGQSVATSLLRTALFLLGGSVMREPVSDAVVRDPMWQAVEAARAAGGSWRELLAVRGDALAGLGAFRLYYGGYRAKGGGVVLGALTRANRDAMRRVLGIEGKELSDDPDYNALDPANVEATARWKQSIRETFLTRTVEEWVADFDAAGVPVSPVHFAEEMADDPQVLADGMMADLVHTITGPQRTPGPALKMSLTPAVAQRAAPALGEHSAEVLRESGVADSEIAALTASGVIVTG